MEAIVCYWRDELRAGWNTPYFVFLTVLFGALLGVNYTFAFDDRVMALRGFWGFVACAAYYGMPYYLAFVGYAVAYRRWELLRHARFWWLSAAAILLFAAHAGNWGVEWIVRWAPAELRRAAYRSAANLIPSVYGMSLMLVLWITVHRKVEGFYGLLAPRVRIAPYLGFLLLGMPIVAAASMTSDFLAMYPRYEAAPALIVHGMPSWLAFLGFELCYGIAFVFTELYFRGLLVIGLGRSVGPAALYAMVAFYLVIHFGKPLGEALASIAGGWALGVLAMRTRSIRGGVVFHLGVAYALELFALLGHQVRFL